MGSSNRFMTGEKNFTQAKKSFLKRFWWAFLILGAITMMGAILVLQEVTVKVSDTDTKSPPQFIQADFIDLDRIVAITKFRSNSGHDFSQGTGETCRSMKHYFNVQLTAEADRLISQNNGFPPGPNGKNDIKIYSPVDGKIIRIEAEQYPIGEQIYIQPDAYPSYTIRLFHVYKLGGTTKGKKVKAGEHIGNIGQYQNTEIAIESRQGFKNKLISYFDVMPDSIFAKYQTLGIKDRNELIITKEYRDAHPLQCNGEQFAVNYDNDQTSENFVFLPGYKGFRSGY